MISIIVPIYNVEKYLRKGVESIINQTYRDLEIILVNDGSKDNCLDICKEYADKDSRIKIVDKPNGGLVSAWKAGVEIANGDYIGFVDPDDYIDEDYYQTLYEAIQLNNADIAVCGAVKEDEQGNYLCEESASGAFGAGVYDGEDLEKHKMEYSKKLFLINSRWAKLIKKELVNSNMPLYHEGIIFGEDIGITIATMFDAKRIVLLDYYGYHYIMRGTSITHKINTKVVESFVNSCANVKEIFHAKNHCIDSIDEEMQRRLLIHIGWILNVNVKDKEKIYYLKKLRDTEDAMEALGATTVNLNRNNKIKKFLFKNRLYKILCLSIKFRKK